jgi:hypothetical protein
MWIGFDKMAVNATSDDTDYCSKDFITPFDFDVCIDDTLGTHKARHQVVGG